MYYVILNFNELLREEISKMKNAGTGGYTIQESSVFPHGFGFARSRE
jgi:hypothetical protein